MSYPIATCAVSSGTVPRHVWSIRYLPVWVVSLNVMGKHTFPLVTIGEQLLLIIQKFFVCLRAVLEVRTLHNGVDWARFLAESTIDALGHIDIISSCSPAVILTGFLQTCEKLVGKFQLCLVQLRS